MLSCKGGWGGVVGGGDGGCDRGGWCVGTQDSRRVLVEIVKKNVLFSFDAINLIIPFT